ncbi:hypothetical protein PSPTOT1_0164 [Pseudomonas syringae pv. tomato T1]|nr:hypothetical protein PSPTOT1_0164 [Pseudomonas syringae pv. tomato T1]
MASRAIVPVLREFTTVALDKNFDSAQALVYRGRNANPPSPAVLQILEIPPHDPVPCPPQ